MCHDPNPTRDAARVREAKQPNGGDVWNLLEQLHRPCVHAVINAMESNSVGRRAAAAETWRRAQAKLPTLREDATFCAWLCKIAAIVCLEMRREPPWLRPWPRREAAPQSSDDPARTVEEAQEAQKTEQRITRLLEDLVCCIKSVPKDSWWRVIERRFFWGQKPADIAKDLGWKPETVRTQLKRALAWLESDPACRKIADKLGWRVELIANLVCTVTPGPTTVTIAFQLAKDCLVTIRVLSRRRLVRRLAAQQLWRAGTVRYDWDGSKDNGTVVPPGRYGILVEAEDLDGNEQKPPLRVDVDWPAPG